MILENDRYTVTITADSCYTVGSADNKKYDAVSVSASVNRNTVSETLCVSVSGEKEYSIALVSKPRICKEDYAILEDDLLTVLQNDHVTQIDLKTARITGVHDLSMFGTAFSIYSIPDGYLIHGEYEIIRLDRSFHKVWSFSGRDAFVSVTGNTSFEMTEKSIKLRDFEDNFYEIDYSGKEINFISADGET